MLSLKEMILSKMLAQRHCAAICVPIGFENGQLSDREMTAMTMWWAEEKGRLSATNPGEVKDEIKHKNKVNTGSSTAGGGEICLIFKC